MRGIQELLRELRHRRVLHSLAIWGLLAFAILQVCEPVMHGLHLPDWTLSFVVVALALGFPVTAALSWIYDVTARGIERTPPAEEDIRAGKPGTVPAGARLAAILAGLGLCAATPGLVYFFVWPGTARVTARAEEAPRLPGTPRTVAVLSFADPGGAQDGGFLADDVAQEILSALGRIDGLRVLGRIPSAPSRGGGDDLRAIGRELKVDLLLTGSLRKAGNRVRLHVALVDVADGYQRWSGVVEREAGEGFAMEAGIARDVAEAVQATLRGEAGWRDRTWTDARRPGAAAGAEW